MPTELKVWGPHDVRKLKFLLLKCEELKKIKLSSHRKHPRTLQICTVIRLSAFKSKIRCARDENVINNKNSI